MAGFEKLRKKLIGYSKNHLQRLKNIERDSLMQKALPVDTREYKANNPEAVHEVHIVSRPVL